MGYQALLFCPDEKLASVVSQVFSELDFTLEAVNKPFAAVQNLMAHRYHAIVVDSENEQNASLLFKSARNSSFNQGSLAIALVEGQLGVANAYRIGANLVLTKPINVEQAKGTLRVARGLLRKIAVAAGGSAGSKAFPALPVNTSSASAGSSLQPAIPGTTAAIPAYNRPDVGEFEAPLPTLIPAATTAEFPGEFQVTTASGTVEDKPALVPAPAAQAEITTASALAVEAPQSASQGAIHTSSNHAAATGAASAPTRSTNSPFPWPLVLLAAPAPARQGTASPAEKTGMAESEPAQLLHDAAPTAALSSVNASDALSFSELQESQLQEEDRAGSGGNKKLLIAAVAVLALAALGYLGYDRFGKPSTTASNSQPVGAPRDSGKPAPALVTGPAPAPAPAPAPSKTTPNLASSPTQTSALKSAAAVPPGHSAAADNSPVVRIAANIASNSVPEARRPDSPPILVQSNAAGATTQAQEEESAPPLPGPLVAASANDGNLTGLMASASSNLPKPVLAALKISQGVSQGLLIKRVTPKYPLAALAVHAEGAVQIEATINKDGNVTNSKVVSGDPVLARAALEAVRQWRYKPYYLDGAPVEIQTRITINFKAN